MAFLPILERNVCQLSADVNERRCILYDHIIIVYETWLWYKCHRLLTNAVNCEFLFACLQSQLNVVFNVLCLPFNKKC